MLRNGSLFLLLSLIVPFSAFALYNGNTALPEMPEEAFFLSKDSFLSLKVGYEGDFLLGRNIGISSSESKPSMRSMLNGGIFSLGFINRVELYTLLGASETKVFFREKEKEVELKTSQNFGGEVGIRANTPIWGDMKFGADAKYFYAWPTLDSAKVGSVTVPASGKVFQKEWQVGLSVSQSFAFFVPYAGVKFGRFRMKFEDLSHLPSQSASIYNKSPFGFFIGLGIALQRGAYFNFEARFIDECALSGAFGFSF